MAFNCFCKVDQVPGECSDENHKDYFEVLSFHHGVLQGASGSASGSGGHVGGRAEHQPFTIVKHLDKASPKLAYFASSGQHLPQVLIELWRHVGQNSKFMEYKLKDVAIREVRPTAGGEEIPLEQISFAYTRIDWTYTEYDNKGKKLGDVKGFWDVEKNKGG